MNKKTITALGVIGSVASIIGLVFAFYPNNTPTTNHQTQSGTNNIQAGGDVIVNHNGESANERIEDKLKHIVNAMSSANLGVRTQFKITPLSNTSHKEFNAEPVWPLPEKRRIEKCTPVKSTLQNELVTIKASSCDVFSIKINPIALSDNPEKAIYKLRKLSTRINTVLPAAEITYSDGQESTIVFYNLSKEIILRLSNEISDQSKKLRRNRTTDRENDRLTNTKQKTIAERQRLRDNFKRQFKCTYSGCSINVYADKYLCENDATTMFLGRSTSPREFIIDLKAACNEIAPNQYRLDEDARCVSVPENIHALKPAQEVLVEIEYEKEEKMAFSVAVAADRGPGNFTSVQNVPWVVLKPAKGENSKTTPFAIAWFSPYLNIHTNPFRIGVGVGGCYPSVGSQYTSILIDSDGMGLVEYDRGFNYLSTPEPKDGVVALAFETKDGERYGPFRYEFDVEAIVENAATDSPIPKFLCPGNYDRKLKRRVYSCQIPGNSDSALDWLKVDSIRIGGKMNSLSSNFDVNMTARYIIETPFRSGSFSKTKGPGPLVKFDPPDEWTNLYYELTLKSGQVLPRQRIVLKK